MLTVPNAITQDRTFTPEAIAICEMLNQMRATAEERRAVQQIIDTAGPQAAMQTTCAMMAARCMTSEIME